MAWRKEAARLSFGIGIALGVAVLNLVTVPRDAVAQSRSGGLPRLEFEAPPAAVDQPRHVLVSGTLRGVMGYRLPLVSRQPVPGQVVSGVLIPAHTAYVILQPGYWELVGLSPAEVEALRAADKTGEPAVHSEAPARGWNPLRLFRRSGAE